MRSNVITKRSSRPGERAPEPYDSARRNFTWAEARAALAGLPGGALNIAHEAIDRQVLAGQGGRLAIRWLGRGGGERNLTYADLRDATSRFANLLAGLGVPAGSRVYSLLGRQPELHIAALGALRAGCVFCPLFSAFGPEPVHARMSIGEASVLVTTRALFTRKVAPVLDRLPHLKHVLIAGGMGPGLPPGAVDLDVALPAASPRFETVPTRPDDLALLHFTSGTTGQPKGVMHVHQAVVAHHATARFALDLTADDRFWCTADPGWVTGMSYGVIAPLTIGCTLILDEAEFEAERWYRILEEERVSVWYTAPTAIRMLMRLGDDAVRGRDLSHLRFMASVGEPLNPEAVVWSNRVFGLPFHDNWWQTETGGIMIANFAAMDVKPGSMGRPVPGIEAGIVRRNEQGIVEEVTSAGISGELALRAGWPSMFRGYLGQTERYAKCFADGWYLTGDLAMRDEDGYFWFIGRTDDLIKSSGHLIGPFEVESVLMEHPAVAEAGVIGRPDEAAGEIVKAFVTLKPGHAADETLRRELIGHCRARLGPSISPREIDFREMLPRTRSGKIMRRLLRARELGLPEGDLSTLEVDER
ncbi:MAG: acetate--CoA ligase [Alphaproteobacteria bacterium]|nr:acetate--CoA ligase [Alphaproteobacteria bacterium]